MTWDSGGSNSYRMGAEGKYDLQLAPSHDPKWLKPGQKPDTVGVLKGRTGATGTDKTKVCVHVYIYMLSNFIALTWSS